MTHKTIESEIVSNGKLEIRKLTGKYTGRSGKYSVCFFPANGEIPELALRLDKKQAYEIFNSKLKNDLLDNSF